MTDARDPWLHEQISYASEKAIGRCWFCVQTWFGLGPTQLVFAALTTALSATFMPRKPQDNSPLKQVTH